MRATRRTVVAGVLALALGGFALPAAAEIEASLDLRLLDSNGMPSFMDGGLGKLRWDAGDDGLQLARARLAWRGSPFGNWHANIDLSTWSLDDHHVIDVTEAWLEWRPVPESAWRSNVKIGAFYAPISLEHRAPGWSNPYTLSSSALNTWIGEEFRTIGVGYELEHLGQREGSAFDFGVSAAVFGWNDPAGVIVAYRGFAMHDRQTPLFGRIGTYAHGGPTQRVIFAEIDNRAGWHAGGWVKHDSGVELRALRYDNRGDPSVPAPEISDYAWRTRFNSLGLRYDSPRGTTLVAQWLEGDTAVREGSANLWNFRAAFVLVAQQLKSLRVAFRYDDFATTQLRSSHPGPPGREYGDAITFDVGWTLNEHVELVAEWMEIRSWFNGRNDLGEQPAADERILQLALRLAL
jgi:hypothetical protein